MLPLSFIPWLEVLQVRDGCEGDPGWCRIERNLYSVEVHRGLAVALFQLIHHMADPVALLVIIEERQRMRFNHRQNLGRILCAYVLEQDVAGVVAGLRQGGKVKDLNRVGQDSPRSACCSGEWLDSPTSVTAARTKLSARIA